MEGTKSLKNWSRKVQKHTLEMEHFKEKKRLPTANVVKRK